MRLAKGFKGRYFSLAAIAATVSCANLQAVENSVHSHEQHIQQTTEHELDDETEKLEDIVVESALPSSSTLQNITSDVTVITSEELEEKHYTNVLDALRSQSDIQIAQNGGPGQTSSFFVRGMDTAQTVVMLDGIRLNDPTNTTGYAALEHISMADVKQIEIIKGAQSGVWGSDAGGGVINIVTKKPSKGFHADGSLMGGSYTTHRGNIQLSYADERFDAVAGFDGLKSDGFPPKTTSTFDAGDIERTYYAKAGFNLSETTRMEGNYRKILSDFKYDSFGQQADGTADIDLYSLRLKHRWNSFVFEVFGTGSDFDRTQNGAPYKGYERQGGLKGRFEYGEGFFDLGVVYRKWKLEDAYSSVDSDAIDRGYFGSFVHRMLGGSLVFNAALRYDNYSHYDDETTGKIGFKYFLPFVEEGYVSANVGKGYRVPSLYEIHYNHSPYAVGAPTLSPEKVTSYDLTVSAYGFYVTPFYQQVEDLLQFNLQKYYYENVPGKSDIQGVETGYGMNIEAIDSFFQVSYTYTDAKNAEGERLLRRPRHRAVAGWTLCPTEKLNINLNVEYANDRKDLRYVGFTPTYVQMGEYVVWNAVVTYGLPDRSEIYLKINNMFDEEYQLADGYNTEEQSYYVGWRFHY
ncbi:TonB-dependent receptor plug domain-containing protein [Hydrogenimonas sp.]